MSLISDASIPPTIPEYEHEAMRKRKRHETESIELDRRPFAIRVRNQLGGSSQPWRLMYSCSPTLQILSQHHELSRRSVCCHALSCRSRIWTRPSRVAAYSRRILLPSRPVVNIAMPVASSLRRRPERRDCTRSNVQRDVRTRFAGSDNG